MSELLDSVFPEDQCLSESEIDEAEALLGEQLVAIFFRESSPIDNGMKEAHCHLENAFGLTSEEFQARKIAFSALENWKILKEKSKKSPGS